MASSHQVTCHVPDGADSDRRIDSIGGATGGPNNGPWKLKLDDAIKGIENGTYAFYTIVNGRRADVIVAKRTNGRKYLKTTADGDEPNNLLSLPRCP